jgi:hypothetical protein
VKQYTIKHMNVIHPDKLYFNEKSNAMMMTQKSILLYTQPNNTINNRLQTIITAAMNLVNIIVVHDIEHLLQILHQPLTNVVAAVISISDEQELLDLLPFRDLLHRIPIILILPDQEKTTINQSHVLRPRFLGYADSDFSDVIQVCQKIIGKTSTDECQSTV